jgi:hypothetical protein
MVKSQKNMKRGSALALAIVIMLLLVFAGLTMVMMGYNDRVRAMNETRRMTAKAAADSGLAAAFHLAVLRRTGQAAWVDLADVVNTLMPGEDVTTTGYSASFSYTAPCNTAGNPASGITVTATGTCGAYTKTVHAKLKNKGNLVGIGTNAGITFAQNLNVDTYGSNARAVLMTNSTAPDAISVTKGPGVINGDIIVGPGADLAQAIDLNPKVVVNGSQSAAEQTTYFPPVIWPSPVPGTTLPANTTVINGSGTYNIAGTTTASFTVKTPSSVILYIDGNLGDGSNNMDITVEKGACLVLYVNGNILGKNGASFQSNDNSDPIAVATSITIFGTSKCTQIDLKNNATSYGVIYAPSAGDVLKNNATLYGAIVANSISAVGQATFHYIADLPNAFVPAQTFKIDRWWED